MTYILTFSIKKPQFLLTFLVTIILTLSVTSSNRLAYASSNDPYQSGYDHGCDDAGISNPSNRYINQPEKGPEFHTTEFMEGYNDGFDSCSNSNIEATEQEPDESCLFDVSQPKCTPPQGEECPEGFGTNEDGQCFPEHYEGCPEGYHGVQDDETGQCYSNDDGCPGATVMTNEKDNCIDKNTCENFPNARVYRQRNSL